MGDNTSLAKILTIYSAAYGDWRKLFNSVDDLGKVTAADVQRVAQKYFVTTNRTLAYTLPARGGRP
jgi:predicted Zn-dependent peptidase